MGTGVALGLISNVMNAMETVMCDRYQQFGKLVRFDRYEEESTVALMVMDFTTCQELLASLLTKQRVKLMSKR